MPGSAHGPGEAVQLPSSVCQSIKVVVLEEEEDDDMRASLIRRSKGWKKQRGKERWPEPRDDADADVIQFFGLIQGQGQRHVGMKTYTNRWENTSTVFVSVFYYTKRKREPNSRERE